MLHVVPELHREREVPRCTLALSDEEGPVVPLFVEHLLRFGPRNLPEEPQMGFHLNVILGDEAVFSI